MARVFTKPERIALWESILQEGYRDALLRLANAYPEERSLSVEYARIDRQDHDFAQELLDLPIASLEAGEEAIRNLLPPDAKHPLHLRVKGLPEEVAKVAISELRTKHLGRLLALDGLVRRVTDVRPRILLAAFQCLRCGAISEIPQEDQYLKEPLECAENAGGCGRTAGSTRWRLLSEAPAAAVGPSGDRELLSRFVDTQKDEIQESPEGLRGGEQPRRLELAMEDDLCASVNPGDRVTVNGILRLRGRGSPRQRLTLFDVFLQVVSIERRQLELDEVDISAEDELAVRELAARPDVYDRVIASIAPTIHGMEIEKEAISLQLFGGVRKHMPDGTYMRGDIHILLVGDPGVAKSQLLSFVGRVAPRGIYTSGKGSSAAGLTAAVIQTQEFGEGRWTLEAGALVMADMGLVCIDEIDKMSETDRESIHTAMEQQTVHIAKAGITATLQSRCAILAAANPEAGRFEEQSSVPEQINLDPALLSRFDVILTLTDHPDEERDTAVAEHILRMHLAGEIRLWEEITLDESRYKDIREEAMRRAVAPVEPSLLRKFLAIAKRSVPPIMSGEAQLQIRDYYVRRRSQGSARSISLTPRQVEAVIRLSEASARMRLSTVVAKEDVERAIRIVDHFLGQIAGAEGGQIDMTIIHTGKSQAQWDRVKLLLQAVRELGQGRDGADVEQVIRYAVERGITEERARSDFERLVREGRVYSARRNSQYQVIE